VEAFLEFVHDSAEGGFVLFADHYFPAELYRFPFPFGRQVFSLLGAVLLKVLTPSAFISCVGVEVMVGVVGLFGVAVGFQFGQCVVDLA
jgi:hypothetical protein